ncbi:MAG: DUF4135 domain-containing protein, partial [Gemmatimonadetes bacterium]|nr:DUF4135 domain-containing protein [Gemmatimonadota bacterium]
TTSTPHTALHAVDFEMAFGPVNDLKDTSLADVRRGPLPPGLRRPSYAGLRPFLDLACGVGAEEWTFTLTERGGEAISRPHRAVTWHFAHLVRNSDGTFGHRTALCTFLRGMADQWWALRSHAREVSAHLRRSLAGAPIRILAKSTQSYNLALQRTKLGGPVTDVALLGPEWPNALPLVSAELRQLDALDYPYFFRYLPGGRRAAGRTWYIDSLGGRRRQAPGLDALRHVHDPFWTIAQRQHEGRFAAALLDAAAMVVGPDPFDAYDRELGVRVQRKEGGPLTVGIHLGPRRRRRLVARELPDGGLEYRLD